MAVRILGLAGSMREGSHSGRALRLALEGAEKHGAEVRLLELRELDLPIFAPRRHGGHDGVKALKEAAAWADALILSSPDYHGSMSGALKNALDYLWAELAGKLHGYVCSSHEKGLTVMEQMRTAVRQCYGWSLPYGASLNGDTDFEPSGDPIPALKARLAMLGRDMAVYGALIRRQFQADLAGGEAVTFAARYRG